MISISEIASGIGNWFTSIPGYIAEQTGFSDPEWLSNFKAKDSIAEGAVEVHDTISNAVLTTGYVAVNNSVVDTIWNKVKDYGGTISSAYLEYAPDGEVSNMATALSYGLGAATAGIYAGLKVSQHVISDAATTVATIAANSDEAMSFLSEKVSSLSEYIPSNTALGAAIESIVEVAAQALAPYQDGIEETAFGAAMRKSWQGSGSSFLNTFASGGAYNVRILNSTPLDSGNTQSSLYGSMMLGCPYLFNKNADPRNRSIINSFVKDGRFLSLTPGLPKYNGTQYLQGDSDNIYKQTKDGSEMLAYLLKNGIDSSFANKDKRYYTFEPKYEEYYAYLESMLNTLWIKMGLSNNGDNNFNIFSFFNIGGTNGNIDSSKFNVLQDRYRSSIGFFCNGSNAVTENISNGSTSVGSSLSGEINTASENYQKINYITGMGTGGQFRNVSRGIGVGMQFANDLISKISNNFTTAKSFASSISGRSLVKTLAKVGLGAAGAAIDVTRLSATEDLGSWIQSFAVSNGMKVVYPELWSDSSYSKSFSVSLSFISPYGDPLSIFKYVYVPFCALLCFGLPRQAAENGMVSPFFIRADIPGVTTSDLAIVSDISWTKGGSANLWTKDGLPRAIDVQLTIQDLYPYLAMTKRFSFLSANPSFTVFLDNMSGMCSVYSKSDEDPLKQYWHRMINRVSGSQDFGNTLWNKFNSKKQTSNIYAAEKTRENITANMDYRQIPWFHNNS